MILSEQQDAANDVIAAGHDHHMSVGNKLCRNSPDVRIPPGTVRHARGTGILEAKSDGSKIHFVSARSLTLRCS